MCGAARQRCGSPCPLRHQRRARSPPLVAPAPQVTVPPALEAGTRSQQRDLDFEFERKVMQQEGSGLVDRFLGKPEVRARQEIAGAPTNGGRGGRGTCVRWRAAEQEARAHADAAPKPLSPRLPPRPQDTYYTGTKAGKYIAMGYTPAAVQLALAYSAQQARNDEAQVGTLLSGAGRAAGSSHVHCAQHTRAPRARPTHRLSTTLLADA